MLRAGHVIALCALCLLTIGVVMVNSADMRVATVGLDNKSPAITAPSILFSRPTVYMALALAALGLGTMVPVRRLAGARAAGAPHARAGLPRGLIVGTLAIIGVCALVYLPGLSKEINGAHRWLRVPVPGLGDALSVQPSEIAKWGMVILISWYASTRATLLPEFVRGLIPALAAIGAVSALVVKEDLGTGALIAASSCLILLAAGARFWHFLLFMPFAAMGLTYAIVSSDYRMKRIMAFSDPYADPRGIGYHTIQSLTAIANGEGFGRGLGHGLQKFGYLPEGRTDFLFAVICEELGVAGAAVVCTLFAGIVLAGYSIMSRERDAMLRLLTLGIISTIALQAVINLAVVTGMAPTKGIALPLLSSGGTGWILTSFCLGLVIAVARTQESAGRENAPALTPA